VPHPPAAVKPFRPVLAACHGGAGDTRRIMTITLNKDALAHAERLVASGDVTRDSRDDWSEHAPSTADENDFIEEHGWEEYARWHLGVDRSKSEETKGRYSFPFGDFRGVHRCAVISLEGRAAQNDHDSIARASKSLLERIDED
jgi:hypothetical protein